MRWHRGSEGGQTLPRALSLTKFSFTNHSFHSFLRLTVISRRPSDMDGSMMRTMP